jgi:hypothetical protein
VNYHAQGRPGGLNYGWSILEGTHCYNRNECDQTGLELPIAIAEYPRAKGCSITGGYVYRGNEHPVLQGVYIFADFCTGVVWATIPNPDSSWNTAEMFDADAMVSSFGEDENGELYATDLYAGIIYRVTGQ